MPVRKANTFFAHFLSASTINSLFSTKERQSGTASLHFLFLSLPVTSTREREREREGENPTPCAQHCHPRQRGKRATIWKRNAFLRPPSSPRRRRRHACWQNERNPPVVVVQAPCVLSFRSPIPSGAILFSSLASRNCRCFRIFLLEVGRFERDG